MNSDQAVSLEMSAISSSSSSSVSFVSSSSPSVPPMWEKKEERTEEEKDERKEEIKEEKKEKRPDIHPLIQKSLDSSNESEEAMKRRYALLRQTGLQRFLKCWASIPMVDFLLCLWHWSSRHFKKASKSSDSSGHDQGIRETVTGIKRVHRNRCPSILAELNI